MTPTVRLRLLQVHRWTALTTGLLLLFLAFTGIGLEFRHQLHALAEPASLHLAGCENPLPLDQQVAAARAVHATGQYDSVILAAERSAPTLVRFTDNAQIFIDPCSAKVVEQQARWGGVFGRLEQLHRFRFLDDNDVANLITGSMAILLAVMLVGGGIVLWWPSSRQALKAATTARLHLKGRALDLNLHRVTGIYVGLVLLAVALTSLPLAFKWSRTIINVAVGSAQPAPKPKSTPPNDGGKVLKMGAMWERARATFDEPSKVVLSWPKKKTDAVEIYAIERGAPHGEARSYGWFDAYSGAQLRSEPYAQSSLGNRVYRTSAAIHSGEYGLLLQVLQFLGVLGIPVLAWTGVSSFVRGRRPVRAEAGALRVRVRRIHEETGDIRSFELVDVRGEPLPAFTPGAHIDVRLDKETVRQYSLCNAPGASDAYLIAVKNVPDSRGGSRAMHERVKEGDELVISAPRNHFPLHEGAAHRVLIAAGIGITPLLSMAQHLQRAGESYELHYFTRSIHDTAFHELLSQPEFADKVNFHYAVADRLRELLRRLLWQRPDGHHLYMCGPRRFTEVLEDVTAGIWPPDSVHTEYFSADPSASAGPCSPFDVQLQRSGCTVHVSADQSIVDALEKQGINVVTSCRQGVCGTCLTGLLDGEADHRDVFLSDKEHAAGDKIMVCVSRAKAARLVLDL